MMAMKGTGLIITLTQNGAFPDGYTYVVKLILDGQTYEQETITNKNNNVVKFMGIDKNTYTIQVTGSRGETVSETVTVVGISTIDITVDSGLCQVDVMCINNASNAPALFTIEGYKWHENDRFTNTTAQTDVNPGSHKVIVFGCIRYGEILHVSAENPITGSTRSWNLNIPSRPYFMSQLISN